ncbi:hypothetical protein JQ615_02265 [Bradyrhizobium jicamae]|uniref:Uncharacterized protein n=1 Tax=Bradyrhizobium jicamae TaxID=280332 RepID=A0ABS5FCU7_9BRAD|nr:hypothetical protein [Bradyrhizobium jicamae]MBR0794206.1 hypothetical protein [Bradyrhizobium jicamae]
MDGGTIAQAVAGQIGAMSMVLLQIGCISPSTQRQIQEPFASSARTKMDETMRHSRSIARLPGFLFLPKLLPQIEVATGQSTGMDDARRREA